METGMRILTRLVLFFLGVGVVFAAGGTHSQHQGGKVPSHGRQQGSDSQAVESITASAVEYVDGPLAPLYDFLIQRRLQRFCKLLRDAGLEEVIQGLGGSWTLFAPTDASFIFLPGGTLERLQRDPQQLRDFILYHFIALDLPSNEIQNELLVDSVQGSPLRFNIYGQIFTVSGAQILEPDLQFDLGRVYIIDHPLYPTPSSDTVPQLRTSYRQFYKLLLDSGLADYISSGTFTLLVPDSEAFDYLSIELKDALATNKSLAEEVLLNHVFPGSVYTGGITDGMQLVTVGGAVITFTINRGLIFANGIPIVQPDVSLTNGVIHVLNRVLLPEGVEADCKCKPSSSANQKPSSQPGRPQTSWSQTQRPQFGQILTTRKPPGQSFQRQTPRPFSGQTHGTSVVSQQQRPTGGQRQRPIGGSQVPIPPSTNQKPFNPSRIGQPQTPISPPSRVSESPYDQPVVDPQSEDDINTVNGQQGVQKKPEQTRATRYPPRPQPPNIPSQPAWARKPQTGSDQDVNFPNQQIATVPPQYPRQTNQWTNRHPTQRPIYPTPVRGPYRTAATTTRRPQTTRSYNRVTPPAIHTQPGRDTDNEYIHATESPQQVFQTQRPAVGITSWQQNKQVTKTTKQPIQQRPTRPSRIPTPPQRRDPQPRPDNLPNIVSPASPETTDQPFDSNRQRPTCRQRGDQITSSNRNLPVCPEINTDECQRLPYNPSDPRPLCPNDVVRPECRIPGEPFDPSDNRPLCPSDIVRPECRTPEDPFDPSDNRPLCPNDIVRPECRKPGESFDSFDRRPLCPVPVPGQNCRVLGQPTYTGDRRPLCSPSLPEQTGCRDPSTPFNPKDTRPLCRVNETPSRISPAQDVSPQQGCKRAGEATYPQDSRPLCPEESQQDCRPFLERPKPGDRRPICKINRQPSQQGANHDPNKGQQKPVKVSQPNSPQRGRYPTPQTTRRQSWQTTTQSPQRTFENTDAPNPQQVGEQPVTGNLRPLQPPPQPQRGTFQTHPQPSSSPSQANVGKQPQAGSHVSKPQRGSPPSHPQSGSYPSPPQTGSQPQTGAVPPSGTYPSQPQTGPYQPHRGSSPAQHQTGENPSQPPSQTGSYPRLPQSPGIPPISRPQNAVRPVTGTHTSPPPSGPYPTRPQTGFTQPPSSLVPQNGRYPNSNQQTGPSSGTVSGGQRPTPQRQSVRPQPGRLQTPSPWRGSSTPRVPISVTGTSATPSEDSRRTLYEIVEDPALLIRGHPVKLTKIFALFHKAGIADILTGPGPTTVFLPSDDAFSTLPQGVVDQLEENPEILRQVLLYHVTNSEILPSAQGESYSVPSLEGTQLVITMLNGGRLILISGAKAIAVTRANNGIFYVINQLLYPLPHDNIVGAIQTRPDLSTLAWLLPLSGLNGLLQGETPYTLLAPTDNAFAQLPPSVYEMLTTNTTALQEVLLNHIIEGAHYGREFLTGGTFPSARGGKLKFQVVSYGYQVNEVNIKTPEIVTGTGVIHLIDQVLLEESDLQFFNTLDNSLSSQDGDLGNPVVNDPGAAVSGRQPSLGQPGHSPVSGQRTPVGQRQTPGQPQSTGLQQPVVNQRQTPGQPHRTGLQQPAVNQRQTPGQPHSTGLQQPAVNQRQNPGQPHSTGLQQPAVNQRQPPGQAHTTGVQQPNRVGQRPVSGQRTPIANRPNQPPIPGQRTHLTQPQTPGQSTHGTQHPSSGHSSFAGGRQPVFHPQPLPGGSHIQSGGQNANIADLARSMGLNRFATWVTNTGLLEKIHDGGVYTIFAPTDDAVSSLPQDMIYSIDSDPEQVKSLLQYHIIPQSLNPNSLSNEETASTLLQGKTIRFNVYQNGNLNCKQMVTASGTPIGDALATMGSVQIIPVTQVLYQPTGSLLNIIDASPILQNLSQAIRSARLNWVLSGTGPLTFFAPSDTAFQALSEEERKNLIEDKQAFSELLKRHLLRGTYFSSGVQEDLEKKSENSQPLTISLYEGVMTVNSVPVTYSDITATNGVLHVIDQFL